MLGGIDQNVTPERERFSAREIRVEGGAGSDGGGGEEEQMIGLHFSQTELMQM
jgi:hypothetical protein